MANVQVSRSYRRAALVLWPRERTVGTLAGGGVERAVAWFADDLARCEHETTTRRFLCEVATPHYSGAENDELLATAAAISPATLRAWLPGFTAANLLVAAAPRGEATTDAADLRILRDLELADRSQVDGR